MVNKLRSEYLVYMISLLIAVSCSRELSSTLDSSHWISPISILHNKNNTLRHSVPQGVFLDEKNREYSLAAMISWYFSDTVEWLDEEIASLVVKIESLLEEVDYQIATVDVNQNTTWSVTISCSLTHPSTGVRTVLQKDFYLEDRNTKESYSIQGQFLISESWKYISQMLSKLENRTIDFDDWLQEEITSALVAWINAHESLAWLEDLSLTIILEIDDSKYTYHTKYLASDWTAKTLFEPISFVSKKRIRKIPIGSSDIG